MTENKTTNPTAVRFKRWSRKGYGIFRSLHVTVNIGVLATSCAIILSTGATVSATERHFSLYAEETDILEVQEETDTLGTPPEETLSEVEVVGLRPISPRVEIISTIGREEIAQSGVQNLTDLLRYAQSVDVRTRGTENVQADISIRGGTFDQTIILLDGVNISDPQTGHYSMNIPIDLSQIERIEVLQGPSAWAFGASPYTGAINIITRSAASISASFSGGMYGYWQAQAGGQTVRKNKWIVGANASYTSSDGWMENTDFKIANTSINISYLDEQRTGRFDFSSGFQYKDAGAHSFYASAYPNQFDATRTFITSLKYNGSWQRFSVQAQTYYRTNYDRFELFRHMDSTTPAWYTAPNYHTTDVLGTDVNFAFAWKKAGTTILGADYRLEHIYSNNLGLAMRGESAFLRLKTGIALLSPNIYNKEGTRHNYSMYLQHTYSGKWGQVYGGGLFNHSNDYGTNGYWGIGATIELLRRGGEMATAELLKHGGKVNLNLDALVHQAYRLPTFTDLYYSSASQQGNPDLKPEQAINSELSLRLNTDEWIARSGIFYRYGFMLIDWVRLPEETKWQAKNFNDVQSVGLEENVTWKPLSLPYLNEVRFSYSYIYVNKKNYGGYLSLYATEYVRNSLQVFISHKIYNSLNISWNFTMNDRVGEYIDFVSGDPQKYKPYLLCDIRLYWARPFRGRSLNGGSGYGSKDFKGDGSSGSNSSNSLKGSSGSNGLRGSYEIFALVSNLFNVKYMDIANLPQAGAWFKAGVMVKF
ncbi:MAG: TonB-dependent receptor [Bacteroidales bacterium]|jgi:iron complex outermembrane receptor protein|nr:TonB-dependent receptor [Bacteroidales bacterium]